MSNGQISVFVKLGGAVTEEAIEAAQDYVATETGGEPKVHREGLGSVTVGAHGPGRH